MKKILFGMLVLAAITGTSCKKDKNDAASCEKTLAGIANSFKLTKETAESSLGGGEQNITLTTCTTNATYQLKADGTCVYTETGSGCNTSPETGTWSITNGLITINAGALVLEDLNIYTWDCTNLTIGESQSAGGFSSTVRFYLVKQ